MATYNGTNLVFDSETEQLTYEIQSLIQCSKEPKFTNYLKSTLDELKACQSPMKLRDKVVQNYNIYVRRMIQSGITVDTVYNHAIYGDMGDPEVKIPYTNNDNPYRNDISPTETSPSVQGKIINPNRKAIVGKAFAFIVCYFIINTVSRSIVSLVSSYMYDAINYDTLLGKIIFLLILSTVIGNMYFWTLLPASKLLIHKSSVVVGILLVALSNIVALFYIYDWVFFVVWLVELAAMGFPMLIQWAEVSEEKLKDNG